MAEVILHLGAHGTDEGSLASWLAGNKADLAARGTQVMRARRFRRRLEQSLSDHGDEVDDADRRAFVDALGLRGDLTRLAVSAPDLLVPRASVLASEGLFGTDATNRLRGLGDLLPGGVALTLGLAIARASTLVPALMAGATAPADTGMIEAWLQRLPEPTLPWAALVAQIRQDLPQARLVVWRHERVAQTWPQVLARMSGLDAADAADAALPMAGVEGFAMLGIVPAAHAPMRRYIAAKPPPNPALMQRVAAAFAQGYGRLADDVPGFDRPGLALPEDLQERLITLDEGYGAQWSAIRAIEGIETLV